MAGLNVAESLLFGGDFDESQAVLDSITLPPTTPDTAGLVAYLTVIHAKAALLQRRPEDAVVPTETAAELAERFGATGKPDSRGFLYSPTSAAINGMALALDNDEPDQAVRIARQTDPRQAPFPVNQTYWWINYGHALAKLPGRGDDAMRALRTACRPPRALRAPSPTGGLPDTARTALLLGSGLPGQGGGWAEGTEEC